MDFEIRRMESGHEEAVLAAGSLFDRAPEPGPTRRFLAEPTHHLFIAYDAAGKPVGFVSGVETTHPDKGTEMFLYELGVDEPSRLKGAGTALVEALATLAAQRGCYGMWTGTETDNVAAQRTYARAGAQTTPPQLMIEWDLGTRRDLSPAGGAAERTTRSRRDR